LIYDLAGQTRKAKEQAPGNYFPVKGGLQNYCIDRQFS